MTSALDKLNRLKQMTDGAEREDPPLPIAELLDLQRALNRALPKMRKLKAAGHVEDAGALAGRIGRMCREMEELTGKETP